MTSIQRSVAKVRQRVALNRALNALGWATLACLIVAAAVMAADKLMPLTAVPLWVYGVIAGAGVAVSVAVSLRRLPGVEDAAVLLDDKLGLKDSLGTALYTAQLKEQNELTAQVAREADQAADRARALVSQAAPIEPGKIWNWAPFGLAAMLGVMFVMPQNAGDPLGQVAAAEEEAEQLAMEQAIEEVIINTSEQGLSDDDSEKDPDEIASGLPDELADQLVSISDEIKKDPKLAKQKLKEAEAIISDAEDRLGEQADIIEAAYNPLRNDASALDAGSDGPANDFTQAMNRGDFEAAKDAVEEMQKKIEDGAYTEQEKQQLANQLNNLANQLQQQANQAKARQQQAQQQAQQNLQQQLQNAGMSQQQAQQTAQQMMQQMQQNMQNNAQNQQGSQNQQANQGQQNQQQNQQQGQQGMSQQQAQQMQNQLQQQLQQQGMSQQQAKQQAQQMMQQMQNQMQQSQCQGGACQTQQQLSQGLQQMAAQSQGGQKQGQGQGQQQGQGGGQSAQQAINQMAQMQNQLQQMQMQQASMQQAMNQLNQQANNPGQGGGVGGQQGGNGDGGNPYGAQTPGYQHSAYAANDIQQGEGRVIASWLENGQAAPGEATVQFNAARTEAVQAAERAVTEDRVPRRYHEAVKDYFQQLPEDPNAGRAPSAPRSGD